MQNQETLKATVASCPYCEVCVGLCRATHCRALCKCTVRILNFDVPRKNKACWVCCSETCCTFEAHRLILVLLELQLKSISPVPAPFVPPHFGLLAFFWTKRCSKTQSSKTCLKVYQKHDLHISSQLERGTGLPALARRLRCPPPLFERHDLPL